MITQDEATELRIKIAWLVAAMTNTGSVSVENRKECAQDVENFISVITTPADHKWRNEFTTVKFKVDGQGNFTRLEFVDADDFVLKYFEPPCHINVLTAKLCTLNFKLLETT